MSSPHLTPEMSLDGPASLRPDEDQATKHNITVAVRIRPLSSREILRGEEVAWYADGDTVVRNPNVSYAYDWVFAPTTTTCEVYDAAARQVVSGAMEGIYGTIIAYGLTSSGKTHTMHGYKKSPGIIPLAVKDAFSIIQETPNRKFLLRVSYLEIYNEVLNDLLNPAGKKLRIRNDPHGTIVDGIKEEVLLSPAHALSLITAGEEHRHVGSANFNIPSSRSHTVFTLTIESIPYGESNEGDAVTFSQLHLIDLAGSGSSRAETMEIHQKEGSYISKSLLTLGMVISKLTDGKDAHIPFRDSKLTRLLQSSLTGQGRVLLICTVNPASSNAEETHNTLKLAQRAKRIEVQASRNKISDEKSLIKKYQNESRRLKEELELRLEHEEEAKSPLLARIQHLTKLILVSTKVSGPISCLLRLIRDMKELTTSLEKELSHSSSDSQVKISECMEEHPSQALQAKDSLLNSIVMQKNSGVNNEAQQHSHQGKTVPSEISAEPLQNKQQVTVPSEISAGPLQNKQQVSCLTNRLRRLMRDMKQQTTSLEKQIGHSFLDSQVKV
ncbi:hypothetical protein QYE76_001823 [Lolium multiflorum]|uniref:Kinesin motor domain-containing protein n=1 Tax=Lolium multiflorum TaxID=4521 RepID=A0AAD8RKI4_LOLMU|nr:hypothetical protein QYE76_001823 [Lolium multiflorum]